MKPKNLPILVIGSSGTIGSAVARKAIEQGYSVGLHYYSNQKAIDKIVLIAKGKNVNFYACQSRLESEQDCKQLIEDVHKKMGRIYGLAICSGRVGWKRWPLLQTPDWQQAFLEHCIVPYYLVKHALEHVTSIKRIVYLSSISPKYGGSELTLHYAAAKSALESSMLGLSKKKVSSGVRINGIRAGFVNSPQQHIGRTDFELKQRVARIPVKRAGNPDEIASGFIYLFSKDADFINGEIITIAGGD